MFKPAHSQIIVILLLSLCSWGAVAQNSRIVYGEDTVVRVDKYDRIYQMVSTQKVDVNTLVKFDAVQWGQIQPSVSVEQRIWNNISVEPNITISSFDWNRAEGINFAFNPNLDLKYYLNRARRERLGKEVLGFSADYIAVGFSYTYTDDQVFFAYELGERYLDLPADPTALDLDHFTFMSWHVMYGLQRRIGNVGYADIAGGFARYDFGDFGTTKVLPLIKIRLGFGLSVEQFKRITR